MPKMLKPLALATLLALGQAHASTEVPLRDFFRNPEKAGFQLSPNGKYVSFVQPHENRLNIHVMERGGEARRVTAVKDRDIRNYFWKGNDFLLYLKDNGGDENFHLFTVDREGKSSRDLTPFDGVKVTLIDDLERHPTDVIIGLNKRKKEVFDPYRLNVKTGELTQIAENPGNIIGWLTDHEGKLRVAIASDGVNTSFLHRTDEKSPFKNVLTTGFKDLLAPLFFTPDNQRLYVASNIGRDKAAIVEIDPNTAKEVRLVYEHPEVDVTQLGYSEKRKVVTAAVYETWKYERKFLDAEAEKLYGKVAAKLPGYEVSLTSSDLDEQTYTVSAWNDRTRGSQYLYDVKTDKLEKLADIAPWIDEKKMAPMRPISYKSRDGLTIHGYLTLPLNREAKGLPVVVNPHGGPWARDSWRFNPEVQWLANRGYAVLQMNFRGSTGYGKQFWQSSFKQWGLKMQDDVSDGVKWLVDQGIADPKKVCIYGASYGGYATLAGVTFTPDLYSCAVDYVGVSNLFTFLQTIPPYWKPMLDKMYEMVGHPEKDKELLKKTSPVFHVDKIKTPLLVLQGARDPRVVKAESDQVVEALKKRGVAVEYLVKDNEGHGFSNEENRFEAYETMERFFKKHLGS
ncbi:S9 family peptidase [Chitinimonas lacunae]|uniref:S9 family peptidase n=1 Tax=Chitinimonas lacunae TaxID=1963018 RepID=A0ABV8MUA0_9NEIS